MGIQERTGKNELRDAEIHACGRRDESRIDQHETEQSRFDHKVSHI